MHTKYTLNVLTLVSLLVTGSAHSKLVEERTPNGEAAAIQQAGDLAIASLKKAGIKDRDVHPKQLGCLKATFRVSDNVNPQLKFGVFSEAGKQFSSWIRLSNGAPSIQPDFKKDGRGFALKLMGVEGEKILQNDEASTQDFLLANYPVFFVKTALDYPLFFKAASAGTCAPFYVLSYFAYGRLTEAMNFFWAPSVIRNVFEPIYYSQAAYRLGAADDTARYQRVKYSIQTQLSDGQALPLGSLDSENLLREALVETLSNQDITLNFRIQVGTPSMSSDNATVQWSEVEAPFEKVAEIHIPQQVFDTKERDQLCNDMSFSSAHSLHEHQPLGPMGRARQAVYKRIADYRRAETAAMHFEPTAD